MAGLEPAVVGVFVSALGGDDRLRVANYSGKTILVSGYDGEPFLRFTRGGVYENTRSPATYLSRERDPAQVSVPASADPAAPARWRKIAAAAESVVWHDHRIHWVRHGPPPRSARSPASASDLPLAHPCDGRREAVRDHGLPGPRAAAEDAERRERAEPMAARRARRGPRARRHGAGTRIGSGSPPREAAGSL